MKPFQRFSLTLFASVFLLTACDPAEEEAQHSDFAVLTQHAESFKQAEPGLELTFPRDHGPHPAYRIEWWYLTANLSDTGGRPYGIQWTLFRFAVSPPGSDDLRAKGKSDQIYMAHMAVTSPDDHVSFQRYARGDQVPTLARAGVVDQPFSAWLDDWSMQSTGTEWLPLDVKARQDGYSIKLQLKSEQPPVLQGEAGFSQKHPGGGGSFYYSHPFLEAHGELTVNGERIPVTGQAWLDREWGSQFLQTDQAGWDWFSLHLESGEKLVLFQLRQRTTAIVQDNFRYGRLIAENGSTVRLDPDQIRLIVATETVVSGRLLPVKWLVDLPQIDRHFEVEALHPEQWMHVDFPYWEGVITVSGDGSGNRGRGYMELTGYPSDRQ